MTRVRLRRTMEDSDEKAKLDMKGDFLQETEADPASQHVNLMNTLSGRPPNECTKGNPVVSWCRDVFRRGSHPTRSLFSRPPTQSGSSGSLSAGRENTTAETPLHGLLRDLKVRDGMAEGGFVPGCHYSVAISNLRA